MSPIIGMTTDVLPRFPRLGKLKKGGAKGANGFGKDLDDHFRFAAERPEVQKAFDEAYGTAPTSLQVYLPYPEIDDTFPTWKEEWVQSGMKHRCDGVTTTIILGKDGKYHQEAVPCPGGCKQVGRLSLILPKLWMAGYVGYVTLETHSINDLINIQATLEAVAQARNGGGLCGVEFDLRRVPVKISTPGEEGKRATREKWLVRLEPSVDWARLQIEAAKRATTLGIEAPKPAPVGMVVDSVTGEVVDAPEDEPEDESERQAPSPVVTVGLSRERVEQSAPAKAKGNGDTKSTTSQPPQAKGSRPADPEIIKRWVCTKALRGSKEAAREGQRGLATGVLNDLFPGIDADMKTAKRHSILMYLFGKDSSKNLASGECSALISWASDMAEDGSNVPNEDAVKEAAAIVAAYEQSKGQAALGLGAGQQQEAARVKAINAKAAQDSANEATLARAKAQEEYEHEMEEAAQSVGDQ